MLVVRLQENTTTMTKVYTLIETKGSELVEALDEKGIDYELCQPTTEWSMIHKIKNLPVMDIDGKIYDFNKAMKWIKKYKG